MFDIGWQEFILIALVAVVVVGPKDLPRVIRTVGQWIRKARSMASEFQGSLEEMAREAELDDVRKQIQSVSKDGIGASIQQHIDPDGDIRKSIEDAKSASGADEIESAIGEAKRDVETAARGAGDSETAFEDYAAVAARSPIPDNSVKPPAPEAADTAKAASKPPAAESADAGKAASTARARKAPAKADRPAAAKPATKPASKPAAAKPAAKPRRTTGKPAAGTDAGGN